MDEPLLRRKDGGASKSSPRRQFASGYLDRRLRKGQPTVRFRSNDIFHTFTTNQGRLPKLPSTVKRHKNDTIRLLNETTTSNPIADHVISFNRSTSSPALFTEERGHFNLESLNHNHRNRLTAPKLIRIALLGLILYIIIGVCIFIFASGSFIGLKTNNKLIDAVYFTVVTLSTIGYGDIIPATTLTKLFTCLFTLVGFGFIDILLNCLLTHVLDSQEEVLLGAVDENQFSEMFVDKKKGRMRIRTKIGIALGIVILCLAIGTITAHFIEGLPWIDSFYLSVTSVTTVGYGDHTFKTAAGRCFAIFWLLISTFAVARSFLYLTEYRIEKRNHRMAQKVLHKKLTLGDFAAADMDHDGSISKAEYVIFKLKEMGKIVDNDIEEICEEFDVIDNSHHGKITAADLMEGRTEAETTSSMQKC